MAYVSPFILADPEDPNGVSGLSAYSDYTSPTEMALNWTPPTTLVDGTPIDTSDFVIDIERDGAALTTVSGGTNSYTDTGLSDGTTYEYGLITRLVLNDSTSLPVTASWIAGGAGTPNAPSNLSVANNDSLTLLLSWDNPSTNVDGTPMDDFAAINVYEDGVLLSTLTRTSADTAAADSEIINKPSGTAQYTLTAVDSETPPNESGLSNAAFSPLAIPFSDDFESGDFNPGFWINNTSAVNTSSVNPPSGTFAANLNSTGGGEEVTLLPLDLTGRENTGLVLSFFLQPQGTLNAPETADSFYVEFLNDLGNWVQVYAREGTPLVDFFPVTVGLDGAPSGGGTYFYSQFQLRFRCIGTAGEFDDWFVDNVFLGDVSGNDPAMAVAPQAFSDTLLIGESNTFEFTVSNTESTPSVLNFTVSGGTAKY